MSGHAGQPGEDVSRAGARADAAHGVQRVFQELLAEMHDGPGQQAAEAFVRTTDPQTFVGSRHHVVPKFLLDGWADEDGQVAVYSRVEGTFGRRNVNDLAIKDFHTFIDLSGARNSLLESLLGLVEAQVAPVICRLLSGLSRPEPVSDIDLATLATFAAFQFARTPRRRREFQLQAEWYAKTRVQGLVPDERLRGLTVAPHQNDAVRSIGAAAQEFAPFFLLRPLALITLDRPLLLIGDDPVVINAPPDAAHHTRDCFLTDEQIAERARRNRRRDRRRTAGRSGRAVHFWSPVPMGVGTAVELALPTSASSALVWGELGEPRPPTGVEYDRLVGPDADQFASLVNDATCERALDWVVASTTDTTFQLRTFPPVGPLVRVCDGENAASAAVNRTPSPIRPFRLANSNSPNRRGEP